MDFELESSHVIERHYKSRQGLCSSVMKLNVEPFRLISFLKYNVSIILYIGASCFVAL